MPRPVPARRTGPRPETLHRRHTHRVPQPDTGTRITPPSPGTSVLACRCGQVLALADMRRRGHDEPPAVRSGPTIEPIRCPRCADA